MFYCEEDLLANLIVLSPSNARKQFRIKIFEDVIKEHESAREKALDQIKEQLKEAQDDLKYLNDRNPNA